MENKKLFSILAYIGLLWLIPFLAEKNDPDVKFHVGQGLPLLIAGVIVYVLNWIPVIQIFAWIISIGIFVLSIMGIINAYNGVQKELPITGKIKILK